MPQHSRREREAQLARQSFVDAAVQVFSRKGFHGATMDEIARSAGYSPGAIYRYFPSKDAVFRAVVAKVGDEIVQQAHEEPPVKLGFADRLRWFMVRHVELAEKHREFFLSFVAHNPVLDWDSKSDLGAEARCFHDAMHAGIARIMQLGLDEGVLRPVPPLDLARVLVALMKGLSGDWLHKERTIPIADWVDQVLQVFFHGVATPKEV